MRPPTRKERDASPEDDQAATLQLVIAIARSYQAIEKGVRPQLAEQGLGMTEFAVLEVLYHKGALQLGQIRDRILVTGASTTYVVTKLEQRGLIRRRVSAEDQRVVFGELTPKGRTLLAKVFPAHVQRLREVMGGLSVAEKEVAARLLRRLSQHARRRGGEPLTSED
jgi:MarR family 2-MHQ and catechol resistance regulon transcriptional repressor